MIIYTEDDRQAVIKKINAINLDKQAWTIKATPLKKTRSHNQNAMAAVIIREISKQTGNGETYERNTAKLRHGIPIMLQNSDFAAAWEPYSKLPYEKQLNAMSIIDVTSLMNVEQFTNYLYSLEEDAISSGIDLSNTDLYRAK